MDLVESWEVAASPPGAHRGPAELDGLAWAAATVPGTAAGAIGADGREDFDAEDWWFRTTFVRSLAPAGGRVALALDGLATVTQVFLNGVLVLESDSMWTAHEIDITDQIRESNELVIACRALGPLLVKRRRPAARWRTRVVNQSNLRWYRTMMFGRSPGFAPGPAPVGPWRPVRLVRPGEGGSGALTLRTRTHGDDGVLTARLRGAGVAGTAALFLDGQRCELTPGAGGELRGELRVGTPERWWPHTHGEPVLHEVTVELDGQPVATRRIGFRSLSWAQDILADGLDLHVNGVPVFARGAVWTPADLVSLTPDEKALRRLLESARDGGMNMLRVVGTGAYESSAFHDLCDELGIMVWQDLMFANLDYPIQDPDFRATVEQEAEQVLGAIAGRPSLVVVCGNSEVEQQAAMLGLAPDLGRGELWDELLPRVVAQSGADCVYLPSTPCGGSLPFHPQHGIAHYFGVSGYFRPPEDARRADIRFAAECLAFANVPDTVDVPVHHPLWKAGVVRDAGTGWDLGAGWDFDDVRDHYLALLFDVDPVALRRFDHERYLELSRAASGEVMAEVIGEWRRQDSPCRGALVLWFKDMLAGAGLGVLDHRGHPKVAYHHLSRAFAPVAVWCSDEGVGGVVVHIANDRPVALRARLRVALYRGFEEAVDQATVDIEVAPHGGGAHNVEALLGRFVDAAWAYRFGPPAQDLIVASLEHHDQDGRLIAQAFHLPAGRPTGQQSADELGIRAFVCGAGPEDSVLTVTSRRFAYGVRLDLPGWLPDDDAFSIEPGHSRQVSLCSSGESGPASGNLSALNLAGRLPISAEPRT
ncbi:MAG: glycoside hydrolase family 2 protein [Solirubrobacteraceae bacterium]